MSEKGLAHQSGHYCPERKASKSSVVRQGLMLDTFVDAAMSNSKYSVVRGMHMFDPIWKKRRICYTRGSELHLGAPPLPSPRYTGRRAMVVCRGGGGRVSKTCTS